jgi:hypothetical protein
MQKEKHANIYKVLNPRDNEVGPTNKEKKTVSRQGQPGRTKRKRQ